MKRPKAAVIQRYNCTVTAPTAQIATQLFEDLITANHTDTYQPYVVVWRGLTGLVWREPTVYRTIADRNPCMWNYSITNKPVMHDGGNTSVNIISPKATTVSGARAETIAVMHYSMAQQAWDGKKEDIKTCADFCKPLLEANNPKAFTTWAHLVMESMSH